MEIKVISSTGKDIETLVLLPELSEEIPHKPSLFLSVISENASQRQGTHSTLTKAEVRGGGKKPWAQKHTGNARQGSIRNPHWRHGGVAFGPKPNRNYMIDVNRKMHQLALQSAWALAFQENRILILDEIKTKKFSTKEICEICQNLNLNNKKVLFIDLKVNERFAKSCANLPKIEYLAFNSVSPKILLHHDVIVCSKSVILLFTAVYQDNTVEKSVEKVSQ